MYATPDSSRNRAANEALIATDAACIASEPTWMPRLKITGFDPKAKDPYAPANDQYPHRMYAKDNARYGPEAQLILADGRSKYQAACASALESCVLSIREFSRICLADDACRNHHSKVFGAP
jgi:hypothetical protein